MHVVYRPALREDASRLHEIRRRSILELSPPEMSLAESQAWAERLTLAGMEQKLGEFEIWVAELGAVLAGWGAIRGDRLKGCMWPPNLPGRASGPDCSTGSKG